MSKVVAGDYTDRNIREDFFPNHGWKLSISQGFLQPNILLIKSNIAYAELLNINSRYSMSSAVGRAWIGNLICGPIGLIAAITAKKKNVYHVAVEFCDGKKSILALDKHDYNKFVTEVF